MTSYNSNSKRTVGFSDYWWFILSLIPFFNWLPIFVAGVKTKKAKWIFWGFVYLLLIIAATLFSSYKKMMPENEFLDDIHGLLAIGFFLSWIISIFHIFSIKNEYLYYLSQIPKRFVNERVYNSTTGSHYTQVRRNLGKHGRILSAIENLRNQIALEVKKAGKENALTAELIPVIDRYVNQTQELAVRDTKLEGLLKNSNTKEVEFKIREMRRKIDRTDNAELMQQYMETISSLEQSKKMYSNFQDQREVIRLKLDGALMEMKKIKMNLLSMEDLSSREQNSSYLKDFENKSQELSTYLEVLNDYK